MSPRCPYCRVEAAPLRCPGCGAPLHAACALELGGCAACGASPPLGELGPGEGWIALGAGAFARHEALETEPGPRRLRLLLPRPGAAPGGLLLATVEARGAGSPTPLRLILRPARVGWAPWSAWRGARWTIRPPRAPACGRWEVRLPVGDRAGPHELLLASGGARAGLRMEVA